MKAQYNRENDVLMLHLGEGVIDHAEDAEGLIIHFSAEDRPLLVEILEASDFLARLTKMTATAAPGTVLDLMADS